MEPLLGASPLTFLGTTVILTGFAAYMTGHSLARNWRPAWQILPYGLLLGGVSRFLIHALFGGVMFSATGYLIDSAVLLAISWIGFRLMQVRKMVGQYPWLYERAGPFAWRDKPQQDR